MDGPSRGFEREPIQFGLRGDSYLWRELRARFADTPLPDCWFALRALITDAIEHVVGEPLTNRELKPWHDNDAAIYLPEFDPGHGMSAGAVHVPWWAHTGVPLLLDRYVALRGSKGLQED